MIVRIIVDADTSLDDGMKGKSFEEIKSIIEQEHKLADAKSLKLVSIEEIKGTI